MVIAELVEDVWDQKQKKKIMKKNKGPEHWRARTTATTATTTQFPWQRARGVGGGGDGGDGTVVDRQLRW